MLTTYAIVAVIAYLLGSIPFGYILVRVFRGEDVRAIGSGNIGATNVARSSPLLGVATLLLDAAKGFLAVLIAVNANYQFVLRDTQPGIDSGLFLSNSAGLGAMAALFAVLGHIFPVWLKFRGGKGVATGVGAFVALAPKAVLLVLAVFVLIVVSFRYVSLGSIVGAAIFPLIVFVAYHGRASSLELAFMIAASLLIILKHHENIRRLLAGTEHRFELKRTGA